MDCEYSFDMLEFLDMAVVHIDVKCNQSRLPVVSVDDVWFKIKVQQAFQNCFGIECESFAVITVTIKVWTVKVEFVVSR